MKPVELKRRDFLKSVGYVALSICAVSVAHAQENPASEEAGFVTRSGPSNFAPLPGHYHDLFVASKLLQQPPKDGVRLTTTTAYFHYHAVKLTQDQLTAIAQGQTVTVPDTVNDHSYAIKLSGNI